MPFPTELMVCVLLIKQLFNLSDEQMEFQLLDRLSFQRFVGLRTSSQIPDRTTIWTFKECLIKSAASESIFDAINQQLSKHGYITRGGQMIDASIVQVPKQSLNKGEKELVSQEAMPIEWKPAKRRQKDMDARWTKKHGKKSSRICSLNVYIIKRVLTRPCNGNMKTVAANQHPPIRRKNAVEFNKIFHTQAANQQRQRRCEQVNLTPNKPHQSKKIASRK